MESTRGNWIERLSGPVVLIGGGKMGLALAQGWQRAGLPPERLIVVEPNVARRAELNEADLRGQLVQEVAELGRETQAAALVLAVKPQAMDSAAPACRALLGPASIAVSVAAGTPITALRELLGDVPVVRVMPNTPAAIGRGAAVLCAGPKVDAAGRDLAEALMASSSKTFWIDDEEEMHAVTALSGSGPAYVFLLIEAMAEAGRALGLTSALAEQLALATVAGAGELAATASMSPGVLRQNVTSPNGTTQAALDLLMADNGLRRLIAEAMARAAARSRELAGS